MIAIIRIKGKVKIKKKIEETLKRLRLGKKYTCVVINEKDKIKRGMLKKVENFVAYGEIDKGTLMRLIEKRAKPIEKNKKINIEGIVKGLEKGKKPEELDIKGYFNLHPPRRGIKSSKRHFPKGILGNNKNKINKLIERML